MSYFPDLTQYVHMKHETSGVLNVGWLEKGKPFELGDVSEEFINRLWILCGTPVYATRGFYSCEFCGEEESWPIKMSMGGIERRLGDAEIRVVARNGCVYASPNLIIHYIVKHNYLPPREFIQAVMDGFLPGSDEYEMKKKEFNWY